MIEIQPFAFITSYDTHLGSQMFSADFKRLYFLAIGVEERDKAGLEEAYKTAHRIREFEIELYWKRTAYIWAMQAALIGIVLFLKSGGDVRIKLDFFNPSIVISTSPSSSTLISILLTSTLALTVAWLWYLLIEGAKFWQDNWERHVDILGEKLGQNLYQVYPIRKFDGLEPYSVTKINGYVVVSFVIFWIVNIFWALWCLYEITDVSLTIEFFITFLGWIFCYAAFVFVPAYMFSKSLFFKGLRMGGLGSSIVGGTKDVEKPALYSRKNCDQ
ncbi:hypothetical protein AN476_21310 [Phaeobacter sp. 11ANDIMAR09]|nr:hypothetical protein AN476_21310 [Phaeobacter sp. 11ANDIMAR09]